MESNVTRRQFLKTATVASASSLAVPYIMRSEESGAPAQSPNNKLNVACIGVGGRATAGAVNGMKSENFVAFCDVDDERAKDTYEKYPDVPRYRDFRKLLDKHAHEIDVVTVTTPDHMHFPIAMSALQLGKHVFCEKPLTHTIWEARQIAKMAAEKKVMTQMGNQGHASEGIRLLKEWIDAGVLGDVREVHSWTDRPTGVWPQGSVPRIAKGKLAGSWFVNAPDHSKFVPVVPPTLDWDIWQGISKTRPFDPMYLPFNWRGFWDYGTGALGDMGCHLLDGAHWALQLDAPTHIEATSGYASEISGPSSSMVTFQFPARGKFAPCILKWYDGGLIPPPPPEWTSARPLPDNGTLFVGTKATVFATLYYESVRIIPETKMQEIAPSLPPKTIPRIEMPPPPAGGNQNRAAIPGRHFVEFIRACKGGPAAGSNFSVASRLTELCLLSNVAVRARRPVEWDAAAMKVTNIPEANQYLTKEYRPGFGV
jgi:predicted dehydrogenase